MYTLHPMTYLDWAATAPPMESVLTESSAKALELYANPSSIHAAGKAARRCIEQSRDMCGKYLGVAPNLVHFTASGTESNNIVFSSLLFKKTRGSVVISGIEHPSIYEPAKMLECAGFTVTYVKAESNGIVDPARIAACVGQDTVMVALMLVNNETGAIQPVGEVSHLIREKESCLSRRIHIHTDAVQAFGKMRISCDELGIDSLSASAHKIGALRGAGVLYLSQPFDVVFRGGGQEDGIRPGTENLQAIFALTSALEIWEEKREEWNAKAVELRQNILNRLISAGARLFDPSYLEKTDRYSPYIIMASFPPIPGEVLVRVMSDNGFSISTGSACSARGKKNLRVVQNMHADRAFSESAVRISFGPSTSESECDAFCSALEREVTALINQLGGR